MNKGLLLSDDLVFASRIIGAAHARGLDMEAARAAPALLAKAHAELPPCVVIDLQNPGLDIAALVPALKSAGNPRIVAYGAHVDAAALKAARAAGCDLVMPRSQFAEKLAEGIADWF